MFVSDEVVLAVGFAAASARLANVADGALLNASRDAYSAGATGLARIGPLGSAPGVSRLVRVQLHDLPGGADRAGLALRWEAVGPGGGLFPALDADLTVTRAGQKTTVLRLAGVYRPPLGALGAGLDRAILHRVAAATIRAFINRVADAIVHPAQAGAAAVADAVPPPLPSALENP
jgi:hypothetical protein